MLFLGEDFVGEVIKVRLNATLSQNVVIYIVEVSTDTVSGRLLPYLTANAKFEVSNIEETYFNGSKCGSKVEAKKRTSNTS